MLIPKSYIIETNRLFFRIPSLEDLPVIFAATRYKGFNDGMLWDPPANQDELIKPHENTIKDWEDKKGYTFSIIRRTDKRRTDNVLVGRISIRKENDLTWNIGFWTHPEYHNKGYMSEATSAIIEFGFLKLHVEKIIACHALWNKASEMVLKKNGMKFLKYLEKGFQKNGVWFEENVLEIKREEWRKFLPPLLP